MCALTLLSPALACFVLRVVSAVSSMFATGTLARSSTPSACPLAAPISAAPRIRCHRGNRLTVRARRSFNLEKSGADAELQVYGYTKSAGTLLPLARARNSAHDNSTHTHTCRTCAHTQFSTARRCPNRCAVSFSTRTWQRRPHVPKATSAITLASHHHASQHLLTWR